MQRNTKRIVGKGVVCLLCFLLGGVATLGITWHLLGQDGRTLLQAHQLIEKRFVGEYDPAENLSATLETMVDSLGDRWSYYLDPEEAQRTREARSNAYVGIGVTVSQEPSDGLEIVGVTAGSPAQEAGLQVGEIIRAVDGQALQPETREEAVEAIKGEEGTWLTLEVEAADGTRRTVELQRKQVHGITAAWKLLEDQVGLVTIQNFYAGTADLVKQGVAELQAQGARALVFDVRNNPGGYVTELTEILDDLLPEGKIFINRSSDGKETVYTSDADCVDLPMAVLVAGEQTSGKGFSQVLFDLPDGSAIGLSTARYYTGGGVSLIGTGLTPDPLCSLSEEDEQKLLAGQLEPQEDEQLQAAIQAMEK